MTSIFIATPAKPAQVHTAYLHSLIGSLDALRAAGVEFTVNTVEDCIVGRARAAIVSLFMASDASHLWFIDADMGWKPDAPLRLLAHDLDLVAGCSADRYGDWTTFGFDFRWKDGLIQAEDYIGFAFVMLKRSCIEKMAAAYPELKTDNEPCPEHYHAFFNEMMWDGKMWSEDYSFSKRWRAIGGELNVDPNIWLAHYTSGHFSRRLADWIRPPAGPDEDARGVAIGDHPDPNMTDDGAWAPRAVRTTRIAA